MDVQLITPEKVFYSGTSTMVVAPGLEGDFGVLPGHAPFISILRPGVVTIDTGAGALKIVVAGGIAEAVPDHCTILAEMARNLDDFADNEALAAIRTVLKDAREEFAEAQRIGAYAREKEAEKKIVWAEAVFEALGVAH